MKLAMVAKELAVNVFSTRSRWQRKLCLTTNLYLSEQSVDLGSDGRSEEGLRLDLRLFGPKLFQSENIYNMFFFFMFFFSIITTICVNLRPSHTENCCALHLEMKYKYH